MVEEKIHVIKNLSRTMHLAWLKCLFDLGCSSNIPYPVDLYARTYALKWQATFVTSHAARRPLATAVPKNTRSAVWQV
jgi:hypothetical protein